MRSAGAGVHPRRARSGPSRLLRGVVIAIAALVVPCLSTAQSLDFYIGSVGPGVLLWLPPPVVDVSLDIDYAPSSAEGNGLYGFSELEISVTGDLTISASGFVCETFGCLYSPAPFVGGTSIRLSGADNLTGEFVNAAHLLTLEVSGTTGYVVAAKGRYLDASGVGMGIGSIRDIALTPLAIVPEPTTSSALLIGALGLALGARRRAAGRGVERRPAPATDGRDAASLR